MAAEFPQSALELLRQLKLVEGGFDTLARDAQLDALCEEARDQFSVSGAALTLLSGDQQLLPARAGIDIDRTPRKIAFCNYTILNDDVLVVPDTREDPRFRDNPLTTTEPFVRFYAGAPLIYQEGIRLGAFCLIDTRPRTFSLGERAELIDFAERAVSLMVAKLDSAP